MKNLVYAALLFLGSVPALASTAIQVEKANLSFDTFVRVDLPAVISEADDASLLGTSLSYRQSLRYSAGVQKDFRRSIPTEVEVKQVVDSELCSEIHSVLLNPIRDNGAKGNQQLAMKMRPKSILLTGPKYSRSFNCPLEKK